MLAVKKGPLYSISIFVLKYVQQRTQIKQIKPMFYYKEGTYLLLNVG